MVNQMRDFIAEHFYLWFQVKSHDQHRKVNDADWYIHFDLILSRFAALVRDHALEK